MEVRFCADTVAKVFLRVERKFLEPLIRFALGEIDHGPP